MVEYKIGDLVEVYNAFEGIGIITDFTKGPFSSFYVVKMLKTSEDTKEFLLDNKRINNELYLQQHEFKKLNYDNIDKELVILLYLDSV